MTFEYRNAADDRVAVAPLGDVVWLKTTPGGCEIPPDRVEELVATVRDAARTAAARQTTGQDDTEPAYYGVNGCTCRAWTNRGDGARWCTADDTIDMIAGWDPGPGCPRHRPVVEEPDPTTADDPTPLRWGLGDVLHGDDDTVIVCLSGPAPDRAPYWLELDPERAAALRDDLAPAVGQPAEAQAADRAKLRERIASLFRSPAGAERLGDATPGEIADAVLSVLTVEDER